MLVDLRIEVDFLAARVIIFRYLGINSYSHFFFKSRRRPLFRPHLGRIRQWKVYFLLRANKRVLQVLERKLWVYT
jgi:hypothetical protein